MKDVLFKVGIIIILAALVVVIGIATACQVVDTTQAKFERGQMIEFKAGGVGQIMRRSGINEGMPWDLTPVFRYEVRRENGRKVWYSEWEMDNLIAASEIDSNGRPLF